MKEGVRPIETMCRLAEAEHLAGCPGGQLRDAGGQLADGDPACVMAGDAPATFGDRALLAPALSTPPMVLGRQGHVRRRHRSDP